MGPWESLPADAQERLADLLDVTSAMLDASDDADMTALADRTDAALDAAVRAILAAPGHEHDTREVVEHNLRRLVSVKVVEPRTGLVLEPPRDLRLTHIPGHAERNPWVVITERDVQALRSEIREGQVWVNETEAPNSDDAWWDDIRSAVQDQRRRIGAGSFSPGGRPAGSVSAETRAALDVLAVDPETSDTRLWAALSPGTPYRVKGDPALTEANLRAVKRIRRLAPKVPRNQGG